VFENVSVAGFSIGYRNLNNLSVGQVWQNPGFSNNSLAQEEHLLSQSPDPEQFYENVILPHKLDLSLE
jgi:hypothetical protein